MGFFKEILIDTFRDADDWFEYVMGGIAWFVFLLISGLILCVTLWLIDSSFMPIKKDNGVICSKCFTPAHTETTWINTGKTMYPHTTFHPDAYDLEIEINGLKDDFRVSESVFNHYQTGDVISCEYTGGRLFNSLYIKSFE